MGVVWCAAVCGVLWWCVVVCGGGVLVVVALTKLETTTCVSRPPHTYAPYWGGRTPGSRTPGVPATPSPRQLTAANHEGLKKWALTSNQTECEKCRKIRHKCHPARHTKCTVNKCPIFQVPTTPVPPQRDPCPSSRGGSLKPPLTGPQETRSTFTLTGCELF